MFFSCNLPVVVAVAVVRPVIVLAVASPSGQTSLDPSPSLQLEPAATDYFIPMPGPAPERGESAGGCV